MANIKRELNPATKTSSIHHTSTPTLRDARMSPSEPATPELSINDILAFNKEELAQYMKRNRGPDGAFVLDVEGWEDLDKGQRDELAERLR